MSSRCPLITIALLAGLAACDQDPNRPGISDAFLAARFEALSKERTEAGDGYGAAAATGAALGLRRGLRPSVVSITLDGVTEQYRALAAEYAYGDDNSAGPLPPPPFVVRTMIAWRGAQPDRFLAISVPGDTGTFAPPCPVCLTAESDLLFSLPAFGILSERGRPPLIAVAGGVRATRQSLGAECPVPKRPTSVPGLDPVACHRALFFARFTMTANEMSTTSSAPRSRIVQMAGHEVPGVRILHPPFPTL